MKAIHTTSCGTCMYRRTDDGYEVFLVRPHKDRDRWGVPKGHINEGETEEECAIRETIEETGYTPIMTDRQLASVRVKHAYEHKTVKIWMAEVNDSAPLQEPDGENFDMRWFNIDNLPDLHKYQVSLLAEVVSFLKAR